MNVNSPKLLEQQLDFLEQQSDLERWKRDHEFAMLCCDIDDLIALALETLEQIRKRRGAPDPAPTFHFFRRWHRIALRALACVEHIEGAGYPPERADELRFAVNEASIAVDHDRVATAQQRLAAGMGRSLEDVANEAQVG